MTIPREIRAMVRARAGGECEYCRLPQSALIIPHQVDHIIGQQHNGPDDADNLCLCCTRCNLKKGPNIASIDPRSGVIVALFHPRRQVWRDHFSLGSDGRLLGLTPEGRATVGLLGVNDTDRAQMRALLLREGWAPSLA